MCDVIGIEARRYEPARANVGASTSRARPAAAGSFTVMRHSVRACRGRAAWRGAAATRCPRSTTSPGAYVTLSRYRLARRVRRELVEQRARFVVGHADDAERAAGHGVQRLAAGDRMRAHDADA